MFGSSETISVQCYTERCSVYIYFNCDFFGVIQNVVQSTSILIVIFSVKFVVIKMENPNEFTEKQPPTQEQPTQEQPSKEQPTKEQPTHLPGVKEVAQKFLADLDEKQPPNQDQPTQEQPAKEQPTKEQPTKEQPTHLPRVNEVAQEFLADLDEKQPPNQDQPTQEQPSKEQPTKEQPTHLPGVKEVAQKFLADLDEKQPPNQDQPTQEQPAKEQPTKEQPTKEQPTHLPRVNEVAQEFLADLDEKQPPNQDQPTQEQPSKEQPTKEQPTKEQPTHLPRVNEVAQEFLADLDEKQPPNQDQPTQEQPSKEQPTKEQPTHLPRVNEVQKFLADLDEERKRLSAEFPLCALLIDEAVDRVYGTGHIPGKERFSDVYQQKPMKITQKVFVPVNQFPKFNFVGKILGPKGNSLRRLQEESQCKIAIKGRSSIRDRNKEEQLRSSGDRRYAHLEKNLFLEVSTVAPPAECYARIAYALAEIRKYLIPDDNDEVWHEQQRELMEMNPELAKNTKGLNLPAYRSVFEKMIGGNRTGVVKYNNLIKRYKENPPKSVFDETFGGNRTGVPKYNKLIKRDKENPPEVADMEEVAYKHRMLPSRPSMRYENRIPRPSIRTTNAAPLKRPYPYPTDVNRMREPPIKSYKPNPIWT
ncbi:ATP-dependent RNA helicase ddx46 isoform X2 [Drosophila mauritiana]|uniref:ATP-dependent RNA helicase ddx46 isoform X2 n=1 Tax=Drosophila mauritiana TaxID=7226 RepID=A0A6P8JHQ4_DROMA|nr:ATP-dependent RNA helicase ddx46 isoform X2 [Drosophila mauritiana]